MRHPIMATMRDIVSHFGDRLGPVSSTGRPTVLGLAAGLLIGMSPTPLQANDYCVVCNGPDAVYRCVASDPGLASSATALQILCIKELARQGGHQTCAISRHTRDDCAGGQVSLSTGPAAYPPTRASEPPRPDGGGDASQGRNPPQEKTQGRVAGGTAASAVVAPAPAADAPGGPLQSAADALKKGASAVGEAAKKSWDCVASLFKGC